MIQYCFNLLSSIAFLSDLRVYNSSQITELLFGCLHAMHVSFDDFADLFQLHVVSD